MTAKDAIERVMYRQAFGLQNAKPRKEILKAVNELIPDAPITDRKLRETYAEMSEELLFGSTSDEGYYVITGKKDLFVALDSLSKKAEAIAVRKNSILSRYQQKYGVVNGQRDLAI